VKHPWLSLFGLLLLLWGAWLVSTSDAILVTAGPVMDFLFLFIPILSLGFFHLSRRRLSGPATTRWTGIARGAFLAVLPVWLAANALRAVKRHDLFLSYSACFLAVAGTGFVLASRLWGRPRAKPGKAFRFLGPAAGFAAVLAFGMFMIFDLIPWSLNGAVGRNSVFWPAAERLRPLFCAGPRGLRPADYRGLRLEGAELGGAAWAGANLRGIRLKKARLKSADLAGADLRSADLTEAWLDYANLSAADLSSSLCGGVRLFKADLKGASFRRGDLHDAFIHYCDADGADFSGANLHRARPFGSRFKGARLHGAELNKASLFMVDFGDADLSGADLRGAEFWKVNLRGANLEAANLEGAVGLDADALAAAKSLRGARIDQGLLDEIRRKYPALLGDSPAAAGGDIKEES
jgi:uncharacterized protein YjbI with pentapeptide repeats